MQSCLLHPSTPTTTPSVLLACATVDVESENASPWRFLLSNLCTAIPQPSRPARRSGATEELDSLSSCCTRRSTRGAAGNGGWAVLYWRMSHIWSPSRIAKDRHSDAEFFRLGGILAPRWHCSALLFPNYFNSGGIEPTPVRSSLAVVCLLKIRDCHSAMQWTDNLCPLQLRALYK